MKLLVLSAMIFTANALEHYLMSLKSNYNQADLIAFCNKGHGSYMCSNSYPETQTQIVADLNDQITQARNLGVLTIVALNDTVKLQCDEWCQEMIIDHEVNICPFAEDVDVSRWGLDRINQRSLPLDGSSFSDTNGSGIHAFIIDTGINADHVEFAGRLSDSVDFVELGTPSNMYNDLNGHGTHVTGTIGGFTYGVAPGVTLHAVRVLNQYGQGSYSDVIAGLNWVVNYMNERKPQKGVINMSLIGPLDSIMNQAVEMAVTSGLEVVVAAGNSQQDSCFASPSSAARAITVAASSINDEYAWFSNYGPCVDIIAPGVGIESSYIGSNNASKILSGTSMAAPHVAGVVALMLQSNITNIGLKIKQYASRNYITNVPALTSNELLYNEFVCESICATVPPSSTTKMPPMPDPILRHSARYYNVTYLPDISSKIYNGRVDLSKSKPQLIKAAGKDPAYLRYDKSYMPIEKLQLNSQPQFTISIWVRILDLTKINTIFDCDSNEVMMLNVNVNGDILFQTTLSQKQQVKLVAPAAITDTAWHNIVVTFGLDSSKCTKAIYIDGGLKIKMTNLVSNAVLGRKLRYCNVGAKTANSPMFSKPAQMNNRLTGDIAVMNLWLSLLTPEQVMFHHKNSKHNFVS